MVTNHVGQLLKMTMKCVCVSAIREPRLLEKAA